MHSRDTGTPLNLNSTRLSGHRGRAGTGSRDSRCLQTIARLASGSAMTLGSTAEAVERAAVASLPVAADHVVVLSTAGAISRLLASVSARNILRLTEDRFS